MSNPQNISDAVFALIPATYESLRAASGEDLSALGMVSVSRDGLVLAHTATVGISLNDQQLMMANAMIALCLREHGASPEIVALLNKARSCCERAQALSDGTDLMSSTLN